MIIKINRIIVRNEKMLEDLKIERVIANNEKMLEELKESFEKWRQTNLLSIKKNRNNIKEKLYQHSQEYATLKCEAN